MQRRKLLLAAAGLPAWLPPTGGLSREVAQEEVLAFVRREQERRYRKLADALGLPSATDAYERVTKRRIRPEFKAVNVPTPYEHPAQYQILTTTLWQLDRDARDMGIALPQPFLATLASGDVHARALVEPVSGTPVLFFEDGLFSYFYDMVKLLAWAVPPLSKAELTDDRLLANLQRRYTMPFTASESFSGTLYAYVASETSIDSTTPIPMPEHNMGLAVRLLTFMEQWAMAHELAHLDAGDLNKTPSRQQEYDADVKAAQLVTSIADAKYGSWTVGYWGCELALVVLNLLYRAIGVMSYGGERIAWVNPTHPDPLSRRAHLRDVLWRSPPSPSAGVEAARMVCAMTEASFQKLWDFAVAVMFLQRERGARLALRWSAAAECLAPAAGTGR